MRFLIKFPTRNRPNKFFSTLNKYISNFSTQNEYKILVSCDNDDVAMNNNDVINKLDSYSNLEYYFSDRTTKIDAINRDINKIQYEWQIVIAAADDTIPVYKNYDLRIQEEMVKEYPDLDGSLWFNDGTGFYINTQSILGRKYYDKLGWIYYPEYRSWYSDNEHTFYAKSINKIKFIDECLIVHEHPGHRPGNIWDQLYFENDAKHNIEHDRLLYEERKRKGFNVIMKPEE